MLQARPDPEILSQLFHALADPTRRGIVRRLTRGEAAVSSLAEGFPISLPAVSRHVRVLEGAGLVVRQKRGRVTWCRLVPERLEHADAWLSRTRELWTDNLDSLARFLEDA